MKNFLKKILLFVTLPILPIFFIGNFDNIDKQTSNNHNIIRIQTKSNYDSLDILFVGNSYCYSGIIPSLFDEVGIRSYNLGIATAGPFFYELIINDYLEFINTKPKSIFILVSPITFSILADNFSAYPIHRYLENPKTNEEIVFQFGLPDEYINLFKKSVTKGIKNLINKKVKNEENYTTERGFIPSEITNNETIVQNTQYLYTPLKNENFNQQYFAYLKKIVRELETKGIKIVFYELPTNMLYEYFNSQYLLSYKSAIESLKSDYIFLSNELKLNNDCFRNIDHLNTKGAEIATKSIIEKIKNNEQLTIE